MCKNIIFDFDGVILESNQVKISGFYNLFSEFGHSFAIEGANYFANNAGFSRYDVIRYFFTQIYPIENIEDTVADYAARYSKLIRDATISCSFIPGVLEFISGNTFYNLAIVSSTDEKDLIYICEKIKISDFFTDILGSPTKKADNITKVLVANNWRKDETLYVGDTLNDYRATNLNGIGFIARSSGAYSWQSENYLLKIDDFYGFDDKILKLS